MSDMRRQWVIMDAQDDVATALTDLQNGTNIHDGEANIDLQLKQDIPFGHKFAIRAIRKDGFVRKYGQVIGSASKGIDVGEHVHVHNVESRRARGDLTKER